MLPRRKIILKLASLIILCLFSFNVISPLYALENEELLALLQKGTFSRENPEMSNLSQEQLNSYIESIAELNSLDYFSDDERDTQETFLGQVVTYNNPGREDLLSDDTGYVEGLTFEQQQSPYVDPILNTNLNNFTQSVLGGWQETSKLWPRPNASIVERQLLAEEQLAKLSANKRNFIVTSAYNQNNPAKASGSIWCDIFWVQKGAVLKVVPYNSSWTDKYSDKHGYLEVHAKVIIIDGTIDASGAGYLGTVAVGGSPGRTIAMFNMGWSADCSGFSGNLPAKPEKKVNGPFVPNASILFAKNEFSSDSQIQTLCQNIYADFGLSNYPFKSQDFTVERLNEIISLETLWFLYPFVAKLKAASIRPLTKNLLANPPLRFSSKPVHQALARMVFEDLYPSLCPKMADGILPVPQGGANGQNGKSGTIGRDAYRAVLATDRAEDETLTMGSGGEGGSSGSGGGALKPFSYGEDATNKLLGGKGGDGGQGGRGGGTIALWADYSLIINGEVKTNGALGSAGKAGGSGDHAGAGVGGTGGNGGGGAGGDILLGCYSSYLNVLSNSILSNRGIILNGLVDTRGRKNNSLSNQNAGAVKVFYNGDKLNILPQLLSSPQADKLWALMVYNLPKVNYFRPVKGEYSSKNREMQMRWQGSGGSEVLSGWVAAYCTDPANTWPSAKVRLGVPFPGNLPFLSGNKDYGKGYGPYYYKYNWDTLANNLYRTPLIKDTKKAVLRYYLTDKNGKMAFVDAGPLVIDNTAPGQPAISTVYPTGTTYQTKYLLWTKYTKPVLKWKSIEKTSGLDRVEFALDKTEATTGSVFTITDYQDITIEAGKVVIKGSKGLLVPDWLDIHDLSSPYFTADSSGNNNGQINLDTTGWPDGQYTFNVRIRDSAHNYSKAGTLVYNKDTTDPVMTLNYYDAYGTKNDYSYPQTVKWLNIDNYPLTLTATDNASGLAKVNYSIGSKNYDKTFSASGGTYKEKIYLPDSSSTDFGYGNGTFIIKYSAEDNLGHKLSEVSQTVYLDNTKPTITIDKSITGLKITKGNSDYYYSVTKLTGTAKDQVLLSGVDPAKVMVSIVKGSTSTNIEYFKSGWQTPYIEKNSWQAATYDSATGTWQLDLSKVPLSVKKEETITVYVKATDKAENESTKAYLDIEMTPVDASAPNTSLQYFNNGINNFVNVPSSATKQWLTSNVVRVLATDEGVGIKSITYDLDGTGNVVVSDFSGKVSGASKSGSNYYIILPAAKLAEGSHKVTYTAEDILGNKSLNKTETFYIDTKTPTICLSQINGAVIPNVYEPTYKNLTVIACSGTDTASGVKETKVKLSNVKTATQVNYWDGKAWTSTPTYLSAVYDSNKKLWVLDLTSGSYSPVTPLVGSTAKEYITIYYKGTDNSGQASTENYKTVVIDPTLGTTKPQSAPQNVKASISSGKVNISWDSVNGADKYNIYKVATYPDQLKGATIILGTTTGNSYLDNSSTNPVGDSYNYYYVVRAANSAGETANSEIVGVLNYSLVSGKNWISIPLENTGIKLASGLWTGLGLSSGDLIERPDAGKSSYGNYYGGSDPLLGTIGNEFAIVLGGCYRITTSTAKTWTLVGTVPNTEKFTLVSGKNWIYLPISKTGLSSASDLWSSLGLANGDLIEKPDPGKPYFTDYYGGSDPLLGTIGTDFSVPFNPTKCYRVTIKTGKQWP